MAQAKPLSSIAAPNKTPPAAAADDGLQGGGFYLEADSLLQDEATHHVIAQGGVEARYKGRVVRADRLDYNTATGVISATGHVEIISSDGTAQFADEIQLDKSMSEGFAKGFSTRLQGDAKIAAQRSVSHGSGVTEFDQVVFTPCEACADGAGQPTWSIRARKVVEDKAAKTLAFHDAVVEIKGVPVLYVPYLPAADPAADRKSGFLIPNITISGIRGFSWEQPYYQVINASQDITVTPQINGLVNPFLNVDYRLRTYSGLMDVRAGYTYDQDFTSTGQKFGPATSRSYVLGSGEFQLNDVWSWGFTAERASDPLIFDKYSVQDVFVDRGLYAADDRRLISQLDAVRQDANSYLSIAAISIQGLRTTDIQNAIPFVAPLIEGHWEAPSAVLGGHLRLDASAVAVTQNQSVVNPALSNPEILPGVDSRRATAEASWQSSFTFANGLRIQPFADLRGDLYNVTSTTIPASNQPGVTSPTPSQTTLQNLPAATIPRGFAMGGAVISYPMVKATKAATFILEPIVEISVANLQIADPRIPDFDSADFELQPTNLFQPNGSPGYDLYEGGQAITAGGQATMVLDDGRTANFMFGRRFAAESNPVLPGYSGLQGALSDYVMEGDTTLIQGLRAFANLRLNSSSGKVDQLETGVTFATPRVDGYIAYLQEPIAPTGQPLTSLDVRGEAFFTKHWGVSTYAIVDGGRWRESDFGLVYRDNCIRIEVLYRHDQTYNGTIGPTTSVLLRLSLATLGGAP
ncbi:MAG: LPS-assembly protein LptD [Alphaproteobacteria bacterium]|nr:LPS-assembly protein LptD [Alphaproteobacteria bacterium]